MSGTYKKRKQIPIQIYLEPKIINQLNEKSEKTKIPRSAQIRVWIEEKLKK